jgi:hypothetical protein
MAKSAESKFIRCYIISKQQFELKNAAIKNKVTRSGKLTIRFFELMALGGISDPHLLSAYEKQRANTQ